MIPILTTIITSLGGVIGAYFAVKKGDREREVKDAQREQRQADRLDSIDDKIAILSKKVDEHNGYAEKFSSLSTTIAVMAKDIEYLKNK